MVHLADRFYRYQNFCARLPYSNKRHYSISLSQTVLGGRLFQAYATQILALSKKREPGRDRSWELWRCVDGLVGHQTTAPERGHSVAPCRRFQGARTTCDMSPHAEPSRKNRRLFVRRQSGTSGGQHWSGDQPVSDMDVGVVDVRIFWVPPTPRTPAPSRRTGSSSSTG